MDNIIKIGLDVMGGDYAPEATMLGAIQALAELPPNVKIVLIGDQNTINSILELENVSKDHFEIVHAADVITMNEHPTKAFSKKPNSSISIGFGMLKKKLLDSFASTGNTGAMLVGSMYTVRAVSGVIRPCITTAFPKESGGVNLVLDVGSNADCKPDVLYQFGILGSLYAKYVYNIDNPRVGLLNIGEEEGKGNVVTQAAYQLMKDNDDFNFVGNVEGRDLFADKTDVIVCDGFTGNIILKQAEAFYTLLIKRNLVDDYFKKFNYENYGGTPILGVNGNVIIGHGISSPLAIKNMLLHSRDVVEAQLPHKINQAFNTDD